MAENKLFMERLREGRERERRAKLLANLRSGNVVTSETIALMEKWGSTLETIAQGELDAREMARLALQALAEAG